MAESRSTEETSEPDLPAAVYVAVFFLYVALGYFFKSVVLNWIVGPLFLVIVLYMAPRALRRRRAA